MTKICTGCKQDKDLEEFALHPKGKHGRNPKCKACKNGMASRFYTDNKEVILARQRDQRAGQGHRRRHLFGLTPEDVKALIAAQDGCCAICRTPLPFEKFCVDHCHTTGKIRGMLCNGCNVGLGMFRDRPELLSKAISYLKMAEGVGVDPTCVLPLAV